jgi:hypothetical protein
VSDTNKSGLSFKAIGIALAVACFLGCGGFLALSGVGAVFMGAHEETSDDPAPDASKKGAKKGAKKGGKKGAKKGGKKGAKKGGKKGGKRKKSGGRKQ